MKRATKLQRVALDRRDLRGLAKAALCAAVGALTAVSIAFANPQGGEVVAGDATISTPVAGTTQIDQQSDKAIINWQSFNIDPDETTVFVQPNSSSITLNRIFDSNPSVIAGLLTANGRLILINRNGMMFEGGSIIDTAGFIATTADISNENFLSNRLDFNVPGNPNAQITNAGTITAKPGGLVAIVAPSVENRGIITAKLGRIGLGAGSTFVLDIQGENLVSFPISDELAQQLVGPDGTPLAASLDGPGGASILLSARAARSVIDDMLKLPGDSIATGIERNGDSLLLTGSATSWLAVQGGKNETVTVGGTLDVSGGQGGSVAISGGKVLATGSIIADGTNGRGGNVAIASTNYTSLSGSISANGTTGGNVSVASGNNLVTSAAISADGSAGAGGSVSLTAANRHVATTTTNVSADGTTAGGEVKLSGGTGAIEGAGLFTSGTYSATSSAGAGGTVAVNGRDIKMIDSKVDASGAAGGGKITVGFTGDGATRAINADKILVSPTSTFSADATLSGNGGGIVFWSNLATDFMGTIKAKGGSLGGDGGFLEVSSTGEIGFWGMGDASAVNGDAGMLTLDPKNIIVSTTGTTFPSYELVNPGTGSSSYGESIAVSGTLTAITSPRDDLAADNSGAVFVFNTTTGALVSTLTGTDNDDTVGSGGITLLSNGNFVVASSSWNNGGVAAAGAVTWISGTTGLNGVVSAANSLVGAAANNQVGSGGVTALANGNYVVNSSTWDNGVTQDVGAVTWGNGTTGTTGTVSALNSLIGSTTADSIGSGGIVALANGNYVVRSQLWNNGGITDAGAVTWANGSGGTVGAVTSVNSLVGSTANDQVGSNGVTGLSNGNYAVASSQWDNGAATNAGAVTWGSGTSGVSGTISAANSLVGTVANDEVGNGGVVALSNGHFVAISSNWDDGATANVGAVTWGNGATGATGAVAAGNSLIGSTANDNVGSTGVTALSNGNFVVISPNWDSGVLANVGAVTWRNGSATSSGVVSAANSLVGSRANDNVGSGGVKALTNGHYVVASPNWDLTAAIVDSGAATWGDGTAGVSGVITGGNSLLGTTSNNQVGSGGILALSNGNYVVLSPGWDNGGTGNQGAATWGNGATGIVGNLTAANSLIGGTAGDAVGTSGKALTNGNYVIVSPNWDSGVVVNVGAATWGNGTTGTTGIVGAGNSLVGSVDNDIVGSAGVVALSNGNYVVSSTMWNNGLLSDAGAVTLGNGAGGTVGTITTQNSLIGASLESELIFSTASPTNEILVHDQDDQGVVYVGLADPNLLSFARLQGQTLTVHPEFLTRTLNTGTAVTLQASNDLTILSDIIANNLLGNAGALALQAGRSVIINADITTDNGNLTIVANELLANGVINADRDAGDALITMGAGADINAGTGNVRLTIASGAGKTNTASGAMTLRNVTAGTIIAENLGPSNGDVVLASGALTASGAGTPLVVAAIGGDFINNAGAAALSAPNGRWIVYSQNPALNTAGGLIANPYYNTTYNPANPTNIPSAGNRFAYTLAPTLTVTPNPASRAYGDPDPSFTYNIAGLINGDTLAGAVAGTPGFTTNAVATSPVSGNPYTITANLGTLISDYNYGFTFGTAALTINAAQLYYLADPKSRLYGDANPALTGTLAGLKNGDTVAGVASGTLTFATTATVTSNVGSYGITGSGLTVTNNNYIATILQDLSNATALTINPSTLTYNADPKSRLYGDANPALTGTVTGFKNSETQATATTGAVAFSTTATPISNVGSYAIDGSGLTANNGNYVFVQAVANATALTINPSTLTYLADPKSRIYGDANPALTGTVTGFKNGETVGTATTGAMVFTTPAIATSNVGSYAINGSGLIANNGNYVFVQDAANATALTINQAQLTYLADPKSRLYGDANPALTGALTGLKNGEAIGDVASGAMTFTTTATAASNVGSYAINGSGLTVTSGNYIATILQDASNATALTINPATLTYLADPKSRLYGDANPALTGTVTGLKNGELLADVTDGATAFTTAATATSNVGAYAIDGSGLTVTSGNYIATVLQAASNATALTINPSTLTYIADPKSRIYGDANPALTGAVTGFKNSETIATATTGALAFTTPAVPTSNVGSYAIDGSGLAANNGNYVFVQAASNATALTINPAQLTYLADPKSRLYGDANPALTGTVTGLKNGEAIGDVASGALTFTIAATPTSNVGSYAIDGSGLTVSSGNYIATILQDASNATALTINAATLTYIADPKSRLYGDANPALTGAVTGFKNGETQGTATTGTMIFTTAATPASNVGSYAIDGSGLTANNGNYVFVQDAANATALTINQAQLTYLADPKSRLYGDANPALTGTVTGLKNGETVGDVASGALTFTTAATPTSNVGSYAIDGSGLTITSGNYIATILQAASNGTALTINPSTLTYVADPKLRLYGDANPALTGTVTGFKNGETEATATTGALAFSTTATPTSNVGSYAIDGSGLTANNGNYLFVQAAANATALTINPATLTYLADPKSRIYGDANPALTGTISGFKNGETVGTATTGAMVFTTPATATTNVGNHAINGSGLVANNGNYVFVQDISNATALTINPAQLTYLADPKSRIYGDANPALTGTLTGLKNGETVGSVASGALTFTTSATAASNVGSYAINGSGLTVTSGNYIATILQGAGNATALTINPATLTYLADPKSRLYAEPNPALTGAVTGFKNGETLATVTTGTLEFTTPAGVASIPGSYAIDGSGLTVTSANYVSTVAQAASNATALTVGALPSGFVPVNFVQIMKEGDLGGDGVFDPLVEGLPAAKPSEIEIEGIGTVSENGTDPTLKDAKVCIMGGQNTQKHAQCEASKAAP